ncbi:hypothetical protein MKEN_01329700 [Mycena kentingensis (nom. inval.)]|nr:hypothetical protein MKEN_01329700 [Mycena kentingensis (nom. inval.)]
MAPTPPPPRPPALVRRSTRATKAQDEGPLSPPAQLTPPVRQRERFTDAQDEVFVRHLATLPRASWNKAETFDRLVLDPNSGTHSARSWRDRLRRMEKDIARRVEEYRARPRPAARDSHVPVSQEPLARPALIRFSDSTFDSQATMGFMERYLRNPRTISMDDRTIGLSLAVELLAHTYNIPVEEAHAAWNDAGADGLRGADRILKERVALAAAAVPVVRPVSFVALPTPDASDYDGEDADGKDTRVEGEAVVPRATTSKKRKYSELVLPLALDGNDDGGVHAEAVAIAAPPYTTRLRTGNLKKARVDDCAGASTSGSEPTSRATPPPGQVDLGANAVVEPDMDQPEPEMTIDVEKHSGKVKEEIFLLDFLHPDPEPERSLPAPAAEQDLKSLLLAPKTNLPVEGRGKGKRKQTNSRSNDQTRSQNESLPRSRTGSNATRGTASASPAVPSTDVSGSAGGYTKRPGLMLMDILLRGR